ncbi:MAG: sulfatase-like hydrolase/transferase [Desulfomonilaceae bacterium]
MQRHEAVFSPSGDGSDTAAIFGNGSTPSGYTVWVWYLLCLILSSLLFTGLFEWRIYMELLRNEAINPTFIEKGALFWLLTAKSMVLFFPCLIVVAGLLLLGWRRAASWFFTVTWILVVFWMITDLLSFRFSGSHISDYIPNIKDILGAPQEQQWQWVGKRILLEAAILLWAVCLITIGIVFAVKRFTIRFTNRLSPLKSFSAIIAIYLVIVVGFVPALGAFAGDDLLRIVYGLLPMDTHLLESTVVNVRELGGTSNNTGAGHSSETAVPAWNGRGASIHALTLQNRTGLTLDLAGWRLQDSVGRHFELSGVLKPGQGTRVSLSANGISEGDILVIDRGGWLRFRGSLTEGAFFPKVILSEQGSADCSPNVNVDSEEALLDKVLVDDALDPKPADSSAVLSKKQLPNVILVTIESFHFSAIGPEMMQKLDRVADKGLRLSKHYSGSNISQLGIYSLFFGRSGITYRGTLERKTPSQLCLSLKQSGYRRSFVTSGEMSSWRRMDEIFNSVNFDNVVRLPNSNGKNWLASSDDWPSDDRWKLGEALRIVSQTTGKPQFVFTFLMSTHYSYACPPEFRRYTPCDLPPLVMWSQTDLAILRNRYKNAALFLEDELLKFIAKLDLEKNIVIITGDHGESLGEDGSTVHGNRKSEVQLRTPFVMLGAGIRPRKVEFATTHTDLVPTLLHVLEGKHVPVAHTHGRDIMENGLNEDQVVVTPYKQAHKPDWLLIINGEKRSLFRALLDAPDGPSVGFVAHLDESGRSEPDFSCNEHSTEVSIPSKELRSSRTGN